MFTCVAESEPGASQRSDTELRVVLIISGADGGRGNRAESGIRWIAWGPGCSSTDREADQEVSPDSEEAVHV